MKYLILTLLLSSTIINNKQLTINKASYYSDKFEGRLTANGEIFKQSKLTAATNLYPFDTKLQVCREDDGTTCVIVKVNDRIHPKYADRIDLSKSAMKEINGIKEGIVKIKIKEL